MKKDRKEKVKIRVERKRKKKKKKTRKRQIMIRKIVKDNKTQERKLHKSVIDSTQ